ncbi:MAG: siphovirus Gp157 family protein [Clostridia bacterium]|nr:siphovirus Gp157 family protein [Clostridia bacterium]
MTYQEIQGALAALSRTSHQLEDAYIANGGEVTEQTQALEESVEALKDILTGDGTDALGRWLKAKEDERAAWKAEKAAAERRVKSIDKTIEFIKGEVARVLRASGQEYAKGNYYTFTAYQSRKATVDTEAIDGTFLDLASKAAHDAGLPDCIDVALKTNVTKLEEAGDAFKKFVDVTVGSAVKFTKPRKDAEEE